MEHRFQLVLPIELWQRLKAIAGHNHRTVSEETRIAIEDHVEDEEDNIDADIAMQEPTHELPPNFWDEDHP